MIEHVVVDAAMGLAHLRRALRFGVPGLHVLVLPLYVPPAAVHSLDVLILAVLEHAASGSASRATMAVVINIFLEPIVASCWLMDVSLIWSETPMAPTHPALLSATPRWSGYPSGVS